MRTLPKCIIFDWDGTLVGCEQLVHAAYVLTLEKLGDSKAKTWQETDTHTQNGKTRSEIFSNAEIWGENGAKAQEIFYQIYPRLQQEDRKLIQHFEQISGKTLKPLIVYENAKEVLLTLKKRLPHTRLVLLGAKSEDLLKKEVSQTGFEGLFDFVLGNTGNPITDKPNKGAFDRAVQGLNISDKALEVLYIGDNPKKDTSFARSWGASIKIVEPKKDKTALQTLNAEFEQSYPILHRKNENENKSQQINTYTHI